MKIRQILVVALFFLIVPFFTYAQSIIVSGVIKDSHTQEPIAYASMYLLGSGMGKTSDSIGAFAIRVDNKNADTLAISYIGYEVAKIPTNLLNDSVAVDIQLLRKTATNDVVIKTKINKGLFLWRKIMTKKKLYDRYNLPNFSYEAYNKLEIDVKNLNMNKLEKNFLLKPFSFIIKPLASASDSTGAIPAYLVESLSDYAYQRDPKKVYENIKASNTRGLINESMSKFLGVMSQNVNVYDNFIEVVGKDFVSPFNDNADKYYAFSVPDTQVLNNRKLLHFVFKSKRPGQNTFDGDAWVFAGSFEIQKISLFIGRDGNINYVDKISVFQEFARVNDSTIFLSREKFYADLRVLGKKSLTLTGRKYTSYKDIVINSDSLMAKFKNQKLQELITMEEGVSKKTDSTWVTLRHDSLSTKEKAIYTNIDNLLNSPKYLKLQNTIKFLATGNKDFGNIEVGKWFSLIGGNQWEGTRFQLDLGTNTGFNKNLHLHGYFAYGTRDKAYKYQADAFWVLKRKPHWTTLYFSYKNDIDQGIGQYGQVSSDNVFSLAIRKPNSTFKFLGLRELQLDFFKEFGKGFSTELFVTQKQFEPLKNLPPKSTYAVKNGETLNNFEVALKLRFAYLEEFISGDFFRVSLSTKFPIVEAIVAKGISGFFNSAYNYTKYSLAIKDVLKVAPYGTIAYKVYGGSVNGTLPFTFLENHPGNDLYYHNPSTFNLMYRFEYLSDKYAGINLEHRFGSGIFGIFPFTRKLKWRQFWNVKTLWGSLSDQNKILNNTATYFKTLNGSNYTEVGTGVENIFRVLRIDLVWRLLPTPTPTTPSISKFGVFGSFRFNL
jgi:hypothetical protein